MSLTQVGIFEKAQEAKVKTELVSIKEEYDLYTRNKFIENSRFKVETLNAGSTTLSYNTQPEEEKGKLNINAIFSENNKEYLSDFEVVKGELMFSSQDKKLLRWAIDVGIKVNPFLVDENGTLISADTNLFLLEEGSGILTIPETVKGKTVVAIAEGAFGLEENIKKIIIPPTVKEIKQNAFRGNTTLEEIEIQTRGT